MDGRLSVIINASYQVFKPLPEGLFSGLVVSLYGFIGTRLAAGGEAFQLGKAGLG